MTSFSPWSHLLTRAGKSDRHAVMRAAWKYARGLQLRDAKIEARLGIKIPNNTVAFHFRENGLALAWNNARCAAMHRAASMRSVS